MINSPDAQIRSLYRSLLTAWNQKDAHAFAGLFDEQADVVGFDGSRIHGRNDVGMVLGQIFAHHPTPAYVAIVRSVRFLSPDVAVLTALVGMVPAGKTDLDPNLNAVQVLTALKQQNRWEVAVFQNTPAAMHGRPELKQQMTDELRQSMKPQAHR